MQGFLVSLESLDCVGMIFGAVDEGDPAVADIKQVPYGEYRAVAIVDLQAEQPRRPQTPARDHDRHLFGVTLQLGVAEPPGEDDDAVDAAPDKFPHAPFFVLFVPIAAHEQRRIPALTQTGLDSSQPFTVERTVNRLCDHAYGQRPAEGKSARRSVRSKIEFSNGRLDGMLEAAAHVDRAVDDSRHGACGDTRLACDHPKRRRLARPGSALAGSGC